VANPLFQSTLVLPSTASQPPIFSDDLSVVSLKVPAFLKFRVPSSGAVQRSRPALTLSRPRPAFPPGLEAETTCSREIVSAVV
jgi:hypothetical protein